MLMSSTTEPLYKSRNFRWYSAGSCVSLIGDQFTLIALPWLALRISGDPLVLGVVFALVGVPRAIFMLVGGAVVDKSSPKVVLLLTKFLNAVVMAALAFWILAGGSSITVLYAFALSLGIASAFAIPASTSILPFLVSVGQLQQANSVIMGMRLFGSSFGPIAAGALITYLSQDMLGDPKSDSVRYLGVIFLFDAGSYLLSGLALMPLQMKRKTAKTDALTEPLLTFLCEGLASLWGNTALRNLIVYIAAVAFMVGGPVHIGLPVFADTRLGEDVMSFAALMAAHSVGMLLGVIFGGRKSVGSDSRIGVTILLIDFLVGALLVLMGATSTVVFAAMLLLLIGFLGGLIQLRTFTWIQKEVPEDLMGRTMSILMFVGVGLTPISSWVAGILLTKINVSALFYCAGVTLILVVSFTAVFSEFKNLGKSKEFMNIANGTS